LFGSTAADPECWRLWALALGLEFASMLVVDGAPVLCDYPVGHIDRLKRLHS
jgi:hypothetical protein